MTGDLSTDDPPSNDHSCDHSHKHSEPINRKNRILKVVNESEIELSPRAISSKTKINHSTVRKYIRILLRDEEVLQPYPGAYCNKSTYGVRFVPLRVHNVVLTYSASWLDFTDSFDETCGDVKIRVLYGLDRRKITGFISCDSGMDRDTLLFAFNRFIDIAESRTGRAVENLVVRTFEVNRDYCGVRLDGIQCFTKQGLFACIERIYQKDPKTVRHEFKISHPMSLDQFSALIQGGASAYNVQQGLFMMIQKMEHLTEAVKFQNHILKAMFDNQQKEVKDE